MFDIGIVFLLGLLISIAFPNWFNKAKDFLREKFKGCDHDKKG